MPKNVFVLGFLALILAVSAGFWTPASAECLGCNQKPGRVLALSTGSRYTDELAAQSVRPRITIHPRRIRPGPNAKRYCRSWLAKEYRVSGPVIVPQMRCWWQ